MKNTKGYTTKDLTCNSSNVWDYVNDNNVETEIVNDTDNDFFFNNDNEDNDGMDCVFFN